MTDDKIREVLARYESEIRRVLSPYLDTARHGDAELLVLRLQHLLTMIPKMREMLDGIGALNGSDYSGRIEALDIREKLMRWLGFMQGALWVKGIYTIDEMRAHKRGASR